MKSIKSFTIPLAASICFSLIAIAAALPGNGISTDPYLINNLTDFNTFADPANAATYWAPGVHVKLTADINLSSQSYNTAVIAPDTSNANTAFGGTPYQGSFNGNGFKISGMKITDSTGNSNIGLFGRVENGVIENLTIENCNIDAGYHDFTANHIVMNFGALCGQFSGGNVTNCHTTGSLKVTAHSTEQANAVSIGGMFGYFSGTMTDCSSACSVTVSAGSDRYLQINNIGGLCGFSDLGTINRSCATAAVTATASKSRNINSYIGYKITEVGGLSGKNNAAVSQCYSSGPVKCSSNSFWDSTLIHIGGLVGYNPNGPVNDSYTTSSLSASAVGDRRIAHCYNIGGLIGNNRQIVVNSYAAAEFSATASGPYLNTTNQGGLCGGNFSSGSFAACFWDTELSGITTSAGGTGKTTAQMNDETLYTAAGWNFDDSDGSALWNMSGGYPKLTWQPAYVVALKELAMLSQYWQMTGCTSGQPCDAVDWYNDDTIDILDLQQLAVSWMNEEVTTQ